VAVKARPNSATRANAFSGRQFPAICTQSDFLVHFTVICPVGDAFGAKGGAREVTQIPKNVWKYWLIILNIGSGLATPARPEHGLFRHARQPFAAQFVNFS
jgi:hypothetical protein